MQGIFFPIQVSISAAVLMKVCTESTIGPVEFIAFLDLIRCLDTSSDGDWQAAHTVAKLLLQYIIVSLDGIRYSLAKRARICAVVHYCPAYARVVS